MSPGPVMRPLDASDIRRLRLGNHWLAPRPDVTPVEVLAHLGAVQAQEIWSGLWSIGARSSSLDLGAVQEANEDAAILRTWPLRNTVHFIRGADTRWMLDVARTVAFKGVERRRDFLGLSEQTAHAACDVLAGALPGPTSRAECLALLEEAGLLTDPSHAYHLLWFAAQHGVTVMGPQRGSTQTFVNVDGWVPAGDDLEFDDALASLARRYFTSHGPAPATELRRWTGLGAAPCRRAIDLAGPDLVEVPTEFGPMLLGAATASTLDDKPVELAEEGRRILLLSGFDEYMLGYGDRSAFLQPEHLAAVIPGNNGIFRPTILDDGMVIGTWKRKVTKTRVEIAIEPFGSLTKAQRAGIDRAAHEYGSFLGLDTRVVDPS